MKLVLTLAVLLATASLSGSVYAEESEATVEAVEASEVAANEINQSSNSSADARNLLANDRRRVFLGCMDTEHECEHAAHSRGYHHHGLRYDDYRCHHDHHYNGCYAWR